MSDKPKEQPLTEKLEYLSKQLLATGQYSAAAVCSAASAEIKVLELAIEVSKPSYQRHAVLLTCDLADGGKDIEGRHSMIAGLLAWSTSIQHPRDNGTAEMLADRLGHHVIAVRDRVLSMIAAMKPSQP